MPVIATLNGVEINADTITGFNKNYLTPVTGLDGVTLPNFMAQNWAIYKAALATIGTTWRVGVGVPSDALGVDGDFFLNTAGQYYVRTTGAYVLQGSLAGPQGVAGSGSTIHASQAGTGITAAPRSRINFVSGATVSDNPGSDRIDVTINAPPATRGLLWGTVLANNATDAVNDIDVAAGVARSDDNAADILIASTLVKQLDAAWAAGTGQGMRDTGTIANGTWHIFAIRNPTTGITDILASLSASAPTMPSGYTQRRRIGSILRVSASILAFTQRGDDFLLASAVRDLNNVTSSGTSAVLRTLSVPVGINVIAHMRVALSNNDQIIVASPTETLPTVTSVNASMPALGSGNAVLSAWTNTSAQIQTRQLDGGPTPQLNIHTFGWTDQLGRLA